MNLLDRVTHGRKVMPICAILYGVEGIGKSSFGAKANRPILVGGEENDELDIPHIKIETDPKDPAKAWLDLRKILGELRDNKHDYKTLVVDTLDSLEPFCHEYVLRNSENKNMVQALGGYQAAFKEAKREFIMLRDEFLVPIRKRGMNVILLAHAVKVKFEDPITNSSYDTYEMKLHKEARPVFTEWVSTILFANYQNYKAKDKESGKKFIVGDGARRIFTEKRPSHDAKNRFNLPYEIALDYAEFTGYVRDFYGNTKKVEPDSKVGKDSDKKFVVSEDKRVQVVTANIEELLKGISDSDMVETMAQALDRAGEDFEKLEWIQSRLLKYKQA